VGLYTDFSVGPFSIFILSWCGIERERKVLLYCMIADPVNSDISRLV